MKIYFLFIFCIFHFSLSQEIYYYSIEDTFEYVDSQGLSVEEYQEIIDNLINLFKNAYAFYDIAKNPPQPYENYHTIVDIEKELKKIDLDDISKYEFYRRIAKTLSDLKDSHISILFKDNITDFDTFYLTSPFESFNIEPYGEEGEEIPKIFISCVDDSILEENFINGDTLRRICEEYSNIPVKSINDEDPFEDKQPFNEEESSDEDEHSKEIINKYNLLT